MSRFLTCPTSRPRTHAADAHTHAADIIAIGGANTRTHTESRQHTHREGGLARRGAARDKANAHTHQPTRRGGAARRKTKPTHTEGGASSIMAQVT